METFLLLALLHYNLQTLLIPRAKFIKAKCKVKTKQNAKLIDTKQQ